MNSRTREVYYEDMYLQEITAKVVDCRPSKKYTKRWESESDRTIFYPEGGGQYGDKGWIFDEASGTVHVVEDTYHDGDVIVHLADAPIKTGNKIRLKIDWDLRYARMQEHSGEHLVSGLIVRHYGYQNVGFHMGNRDITIDYNGEVERDVLAKIELDANKIIYENLPIEVLYPSKTELENLDYRSKKEINGPIRLIRIRDVDLCACCGTHVRTTGEIGLIHFTDMIRYKGGSRITMQIGMHALHDYIAKDNVLKKLNGILSSRTDELAAKTVECLQKQEEFKRESQGFQVKYLKLLMDSTFDQNFHLTKVEGFEPKLIPGIVNERMEKTGILVLLNTTGKKKMITIASRAVDLSRILPDLRQMNLLKGGGSKVMLQGEWLGNEEEIPKVLQDLCFGISS